MFFHQDEENGLTYLRSVQAFHNTEEKDSAVNYFKIYCIVILAAVAFFFQDTY